MKSTKLAVLAVLAVALTAGGLPAQDYAELPDPAATGTPSGGAESTLPPASPAQDPAATVPATPEAVPAEPAQPTAPADAESAETGTGEAEELKDDEGYEPVVGGGFPVPGPDTPMVTDPDGTVRSAVETDISAVHDSGASTFSTRNGGASTAGAAARSGIMQVTLVFATLKDNRKGVDETAAKKSITEANKYWREMSDNRLGINLAATKHINSTASSGQDYVAMMNTIRKDLNWYEDPNEVLVVFVPAGDLRYGGAGGILGGGWTSGPTSGSVLMPRPSGFTNNVVTHEVGHVLGLLHANSLKCNNGRADVGVRGGGWADGQCTSREYGDTSDLMGYAQYALPAINSLFWDAGGFGRGNEVLDTGAPGTPITYNLKPWAGTATNRAVKFTDTSGETYYLELRAPVGRDAATAVGGNRGVKILKRDMANAGALNSLVVAPNTRDFAGYTNANSTWQAGQTFTTHAGTKVKINSVSSTMASITVAAPAGSLYFNSTPVAETTFGTPSDTFLTCDWNGDGVSTPATFRNGAWTLRSSLTGTAQGKSFAFGDTGDQPICGDWDGNGVDSVGVYRNGIVYLRNSNSGGKVDGTFYYGARGDTAIVGDWDGDGCDTLGVARADFGSKRFFLTNSNIRPAVNGTFHLGNASDTPVSGDWNADGFATVGVHRGSMWYLSNSNLRVKSDRSFMFGNTGDAPLTGQWSRNSATGAGVTR